MIVEDESVPQSAIKNFFYAAAAFVVWAVHLLRRLVPFKRPVYEKVVETFSHLAERR